MKDVVLIGGIIGLLLLHNYLLSSTIRIRLVTYDVKGVWRNHCYRLLFIHIYKTHYSPDDY
jgi:hypothetical protein